MRIIALSLNELTPAFKAVAAGLRYAGHVVDVYRKRTAADSLHGYTAALISLGDWTCEEADSIKLSAARTAIALPTCYLFDHPPFRDNPENFWRSALFGGGGTPSEIIHQNEMLRALKSSERENIEGIVAKWNDHASLASIWPGSDWITGPFETPPDTKLSMPGPAATKLSAMFINKIREIKKAKALTH